MMWYFSFSFLVSEGKHLFKWFSHYKMWKKWKGLNAFWMHCMLDQLKVYTAEMCVSIFSVQAKQSQTQASIQKHFVSGCKVMPSASCDSSPWSNLCGCSSQTCLSPALLPNSEMFAGTAGIEYDNFKSLRGCLIFSQQQEISCHGPGFHEHPLLSYCEVNVQ